MANEDLLGDGAEDASAGGTATSSNAGLSGAVSQGIKDANGEKDTSKEEAIVKQTWTEYQTAREFDKAVRVQFVKDRLYAAGKADPRYASTANIIGSFIDILVAFLYARNPDFNVRPSEKVGKQPDKNAQDFAATAELVGSRLWRDGRLKKTGKKSVRSTLTVGQGWKKALMYTEKRPCPQVEKDILTQQELMETLKAQQDQLGNQVSPPSDMDAAQEAIKMTLTGLQAKEAANYSTGMCFDFLRGEDMQVSLDVTSITDYLDADWCSNDLYILKSTVKAKFPRLTDEQINNAAIYYQKPSAGKDQNSETAAQQGENKDEAAFTKSTPSTNPGGGKPIEFVKVVEMWRKCQGIICTMIDGVKVWASEPYPPPQATARFYPYFLDALFEVDGERHPQSLVFRLFKLQDEYSSARSNQKLTRERSLGGVVFDRGGLSPDDAKKITEATIGENIGVSPTNPGTPIQNLFAPKPQPQYNAELFNTAPIVSDMERISGVQEALQSSVGSSQPKTATEANIQQTGFAARTNADRDSLEDGYSDLAHYTIEAAVQEVRPPQAQRIAGNAAFWPFGMDVQDILTMVEIDVMAGSTGKPKQGQDASAWSTILPMLEQLLSKIRMLQNTDPPMAQAVENLMRETLKRLDDRLDISEFIPDPTTAPAPPPPPPPPPPVTKINIDLQGQLPPEDTQAILEADAGMQAGNAPGGAGGPQAPPGSPPGNSGPPGLPPGAIPHTLPGGVPMPPLTAKPGPGALKPGPATPGASAPK